MNPVVKEIDGRAWMTDSDNPLICDDLFAVTDVTFGEDDEEGNSYIEFGLELYGGDIENLAEENINAAVELARNLIVLGIESVLEEDGTNG